MRELFRQHLDGDRALELGVMGFVDGAHAAFADGGEDFIRTKPNAGANAMTLLGRATGSPLDYRRVQRLGVNVKEVVHR